jgi:hypothetical protein
VVNAGTGSNEGVTREEAALAVRTGVSLAAGGGAGGAIVVRGDAGSPDVVVSATGSGAGIGAGIRDVACVSEASAVTASGSPTASVEDSSAAAEPSGAMGSGATPVVGTARTSAIRTGTFCTVADDVSGCALAAAA